MKLRPLKTDKDYENLLSWIDGKFDKKVKMNSPERVVTDCTVAD